MWLTYHGEDPGDLLLGTVTVECSYPTNESFTLLESFTVLITGNTVEPVHVGVLLCLDQSGSMSEPASGGGTKGEALQLAAGVFVDVIGAEEGIGVLTFDTDVASGGSVTDAGDGLFGAGRLYARADIDNYEPNLNGLDRPAGPQPRHGPWR